MDIGSGIATGSTVLGTVAVIFKILDSRKPSGSDNVVCKDHSGVCATLKDLDTWMGKIEKKLDRVLFGTKEV